MKSTLEDIKSRLVGTEEWISEMEHKVEKRCSQSNKTKKDSENKDSVRVIWDNMKSNNIHVIRIPEGEERQ